MLRKRMPVGKLALARDASLSGEVWTNPRSTFAGEKAEMEIERKVGGKGK